MIVVLLVGKHGSKVLQAQLNSANAAVHICHVVGLEGEQTVNGRLKEFQWVAARSGYLVYQSCNLYHTGQSQYLLV